jgi:hypothetical protein
MVMYGMSVVSTIPPQKGDDDDHGNSNSVSKRVRHFGARIELEPGACDVHNYYRLAAYGTRIMPLAARGPSLEWNTW